MPEITIQRASTLKDKPRDENTLAFGKLFTDHMFIMDYTGAKGWHDARIVPYGPITLDPAATCLHYGQLVFEGLKAYRTPDDQVVLFRPHENMKRLNRSDDRLCMPDVDVDFAVSAIAKLVEVEKDWVPKTPGTSMYVRPYIISTEAFLGVHPSDQYKFMVILSPSGPYYKNGLSPIRIFVEDEYVRSVKGGTGFTKCAGNYAASLKGQMKAEEKGYEQVLWLDGVERRYIEEVGSMNVFFVLDGEVVTPQLNGSILAGITRDSVMQLLRSWDMKVSERRISIDELVEAHKSGKLTEAFGTGTAAVVSPIGELGYQDAVMEINGREIGPVAQRLYDELTGIQTCQRPDPFGWVYKVC